MKRICHILFYLICCISVYAHKTAKLEISPTANKGGDIIIRIDSIEYKDYERLILLPLPIKVSPYCVKRDSSSNFNGFWYVDTTTAEAIPWVGAKLKAKETSIEIKMSVPNLMIDCENFQWKLNLLTEHKEGIHSFIPQYLSDSSIVFVFINEVIINNTNSKYNIIQTGPDIGKDNQKFWQCPKAGIYICNIDYLKDKKNNEIWVLIEYPNKLEIPLLLLNGLVTFLISWGTGVGCCRILKKTTKRILVITIFLIIVVVLFFISNFLFRNVNIQMKAYFNCIATLVGFVVGLMPNLTNKKI